VLTLWSNLSLDTVASKANVVIQGIDQTSSVGTVTVTGKAAVQITGIDQTTEVGQVTVDAKKNKSAVNRLWLIEYYTQEWAKKQKPIATQNTVVTAEKVKRLGKALAEPTIPDSKVQIQVERMVRKAEREIAKQTATMTTAREKELFLAELMKSGLKLARSEDFAAVALKMRRKLKEDDELMLFSMVL